MYKIFIDTNILLDYLITQRTGNSPAQRIMELIVEDKLTGYISPISLLNIFFILRKQRTEQERKEIIESFLEILEIVELDFDLLQTGLYIPVLDYEDGVQYISAVKANVDFIITGDQQFQDYDLELKRIDAQEFLNIYEQRQGK
jgi:predicted nucleic acid-binding protein